MRAKEETFRILESALSIASSGADEAEVRLGGGDLGVTRFEENEIHPAAERSSEFISVRVGIAGRIAQVQTSDLSNGGVKEAVQQARTRAEHLPESINCPSLPDPQNYEFVDAYDPETESTRSVDRVSLVSRAVSAAHKHDLLASGVVAVQRGPLDLDGIAGVYAVANTKGLLAYHPETRLSMHLTMRSKTGAAGFAEEASFTSGSVDVDSIVASASAKALVPGGPKRLVAGAYPAVLEPTAVGQLLRFVGLTAGAALAETGASFLSTSLGEKVFGDNITINDDYLHPLLRGAPFDDEGVARRRVQIVEKGIAKAPVLSWASAERLDGEPTGHRVFGEPTLGVTEVAKHLVLEGGDATRADLITGCDSGVLISRFGSLRLLDARTLTIGGVTAAGTFSIMGGEIAGPLEDMRFVARLSDLLNHVEQMSKGVWTRGGVAPGLRVARFPLEAGASR